MSLKEIVRGEKGDKALDEMIQKREEIMRSDLQ